ncbi:MAG: T9SS type A sorting domain-containing protein, partial [Draconibacterium sp.]|nr:T9SS type A sorting domain-containing protein [Draconibacterium sp.]
SYTAGINIIFQYNHFGSLREGADGNNLKDRSAGLVVRYNWIESGNRQLDLVDAEDSEVLVNHPNYHSTHVYGNILIEPDGAGNSQIVHYGGDSGTLDDYRKGDLYFYNNTIISTRSGFTTLLRLSTNDETAHVFNNVIYTTATGSNFAMINGDGTFNMNHNWLKENWVDCHCGTVAGVLNDLGNNITGDDPLFENFANQEFRPISSSPLKNQGDAIPSQLLPNHDVIFEYVKHQDYTDRILYGNMEIGAFEFSEPLSVSQQKVDLIEIYPNPVSNVINIAATQTIDKVEIYDLLGKLVLKTIHTNTIKVNHLPNGIYLLKIFADGKSITKKIVIQ